jgi:DNA repair exonuclease SbcCD ATPase subunit
MAADQDFATSLAGGNDSAKLATLCSLPYKHQSVWYLNAFWLEGAEQEAETIWDFVQRAGKIDNAKFDGNALDEMEAHRFLEQIADAHTVLEMRAKLRSTGAIAQNERPKEVPLTHYYLFKYGTDWHRLVNASQGDNSAEIAEAQHKLKAVQSAFDAADARAREAKAAADDAKARADAAKRTENEALAREAEAREAEAPFKAACEELEAARADVKAQEDAYNSKTQQLKEASESGGVVSRNKAKVQLDAHLAEDPLPLRKAKLTLEAAQKKADRARAPFQEKRQAAEVARAAAEEARHAAEAAKAEADAAAAAAERAKNASIAAVEEAGRKLEEAEAYLEELKSRPGAAFGAMWWINRELTEKKKFLPTAKGGLR